MARTFSYHLRGTRSCPTCPIRGVSRAAFFERTGNLTSWQWSDEETYSQLLCHRSLVVYLGWISFLRSADNEHVGSGFIDRNQAHKRLGSAELLIPSMEQ